MPKYPESGGENPVFLRQNVYYIKSFAVRCRCSLSSRLNLLSVPSVKSRQNEFLKKSLGTPTNRNRDHEQPGEARRLRLYLITCNLSFLKEGLDKILFIFFDTVLTFPPRIGSIRYIGFEFLNNAFYLLYKVHPLRY